jgi:2-polyprenyl-3-methyl-5-hydroxy-6-metoxy-1,4-benzoquinol methylase
VFEYTGRELESMDFAVNYHRWILQTLKPYLGKRLLEVGAGTGSFSEMILETEPESLTMLEPSANMYPTLAGRVRELDKRGVGRPLQTTLEGLSAAADGTRPDSILYVNVLEHIEDDRKELATAYSMLQSGGRVLVFVPANAWLMSAMDRQMGHFRRYSKQELVRKCREAGFTIRFSKNFDLLGVAPWLLKFRLLGSTKFEPGMVKLYDTAVVPIARFVEGLVPPPLGKNVIVVGEKVAD